MDSYFDDIPDENINIKSPRKLINSKYNTRYHIIKLNPNSNRFSETKKIKNQTDEKSKNQKKNRKEKFLKNKELNDYFTNAEEIKSTSMDIDTDFIPKKTSDDTYIGTTGVKEDILVQKINNKNISLNININEIPNTKNLKNSNNLELYKNNVVNNTIITNEKIIENDIKNKNVKNQLLKKSKSNDKIVTNHHNSFSKNNSKLKKDKSTIDSNDSNIIFDKYCIKNYYAKKATLFDIDNELFKNSVLVKEGQKYRMINSIKNIKKDKTKGRLDFLSSSSLSPSSAKNDKYNTEYFSNSDSENYYYLISNKKLLFEENRVNDFSNINKNKKKSMHSFNSYYPKNRTNMFKDLLAIPYKYKIFSPVKSEKHYRIRINKSKEKNLSLQSIKSNKLKTTNNSRDKKHHVNIFQKNINKTINNKKGTLLFSKITKISKKLNTSPNRNKSPSEKIKRHFNNNFSYNNSNIYYSYSKNSPKTAKNQTYKLFNIPKQKLQINNKIYDQEIIRENDEYLAIEKVLSLTVIDPSKNLNNSKNKKNNAKNKSNHNYIRHYISNKSRISSSNYNNKKKNKQTSTDVKNEINFLRGLSNTLSSNNQTGAYNTVSSINSNITTNEKNVIDNAQINSNRTKKSIINENTFDNSKITNVKHKREYENKASMNKVKVQNLTKKNNISNIVNKKKNIGIIYNSNNKDKTRNNITYKFGNNHKYCTIAQYNKSKIW